jgi:F0F1-type ATP synthase assembly protein I
MATADKPGPAADETAEETPAQLAADAEKRRSAKQLLEASSIGWMFPIAIALGYLWGWGMDKVFGTTWLKFLFLGFGIVAAFINLFRVALAGNGNDDAS